MPTGQRPARIPYLTWVFGLIGRDLRAAKEFPRILEPDMDIQGELAPGASEQAQTPGGDYLSPSQNSGHTGGRTCSGVYVAQCPRWVPGFGTVKGEQHHSLVIQPSSQPNSLRFLSMIFLRISCLCP